MPTELPEQADKPDTPETFLSSRDFCLRTLRARFTEQLAFLRDLPEEIDVFLSQLILDELVEALLLFSVP